MNSRLSGAKKIALHGILQNPVFVLVLGICPTIKKTTNIVDAFFLGIATLFVLFFSNLIISSLRKVIPDKVRLPAYIIIIATFVVLVEIFLKSELADKIVPGLYDSIGEMISLITVNCIIFGRAESFANKHNVRESMLDGLSIGLGFVLALCLMGGIRQLLDAAGFAFFATTAGGFIVLGLLMALFNHVHNTLTKLAEHKRALLNRKEVA